MAASAMADLLRELFETVVRRCMAEGPVGGEGFAVDASMIVAEPIVRAGSNRLKSLTPMAKRAVAEYLATLDALRVTFTTFIP